MSKRVTRRVKVYRLQPSTGDWLDEGTGHVECLLTDKLDAPCIVVKSEDDDALLLQSRISGEDIYNKQQDTLIVWNEPESQTDDDEGIDLALSFQDKQGCSEIWEEICDIQQSLRNGHYFDLETLLKVKEPLSDDFSSSTVNLPAPLLANIDQIQTLMSETITIGQKQSAATALIKEQYLPKLVDLWRIIDDLSSEKDYPKMYNIFKDIVLLNCVPLIEQTVSPMYVMDIMAALEHDPEQHIGAVKHSDFLKNKAKFKQVVPLNDPQLENKIHQTFRLQYLKDVALARTLDEATFGTINSMIYVNNMQIITELSSNDNLMTALFTKLKAESMAEEELSDVLSFLSEMCDLAKHLELKNKIIFYELLCKNGLFEVIEKTITNSNIKIRMTCADLLLNTAEHDSNILRNYLLKQDQYQLFRLLLKLLTSDTESGVINVLTDLVRHLCDVSNMEDAPKTEFLSTFYQHHATTLFEPLTADIPKNKHHSEAEGLLKNNLCELLSSFLKNHSNWITNFLLKNHLVKSLLNLLKCTEKWLILSAIRFFRSFIDGDNNPFKEYIVKENLFEPIVELFLKNGEKYNLLNSALLELFEHILKRPLFMRSIIKHIVDLHYDKLKVITHTSIFHKLKEIASAPPSAGPSDSQSATENPPEITDTSKLKERKHISFIDRLSEHASNEDDDDDEDYVPLFDTEKNSSHSLIASKLPNGGSVDPLDGGEPSFSLSEYKPRKRRKDDDEESNNILLGNLKESPTKRLKKLGLTNEKK